MLYMTFYFQIINKYIASSPFRVYTECDNLYLAEEQIISLIKLTSMESWNCLTLEDNVQIDVQINRATVCDAGAKQYRLLFSNHWVHFLLFQQVVR